MVGGHWKLRKGIAISRFPGIIAPALPGEFLKWARDNDCPWNEMNKILHIGIQGKHLELGNRPPSNLVFLLDVSGSMESPDKLPLLKSSFELLSAIEYGCMPVVMGPVPRSAPKLSKL